MSNDNNTALFEQAREVVENTDNAELREAIANAIAINDLEGLEWILAHAEE